MTEGKAANERRILILNGVDTFIRIHDEWEADHKGPVQPSDRFERALKLAVEICERGDTPQDCKRLITAVAVMGREWILYEGGKAVSDAHGDVRPTKQFWDSVRMVKQERAGAAPFTPRRRESVALLLTQKVSPEQIARFNFSDPEWPNGFGPLLDCRGAVDYDAVEREAKEPGSVVPRDWIHPDDRERVRIDEERLRTSLEQLRAEEERVESREDPEALLREGQYANVVAQVCGLTLDQVMEMANRLGLTPELTPNVASMRSDREPAINEASERAMDATIVPGDDEEPRVETPLQQVQRMHDEGMTDEAIAAELGTTVKKVQRLIAGQGVSV